MPPAPRPGMVNRMWFPKDEEDRPQVTTATGNAMGIDQSSRQSMSPLPNMKPGISHPVPLHLQSGTTFDTNTSEDLATYQPPKSGILSYLPSTWVPYAELIRLNEPAGTFYFYYPFLFGTLLAACLLKTNVTPATLLTNNLILLVAAFMARSAACAWSDTMQAYYDRQVSRCHLRPIVRGAITPFKGYICAAMLYAVWLSIMATLPGLHLRQVASYVIFNVLYPLSKLYTYYAPLCMGFTLATGVIVGSSVLGVEVFALRAAGGSDDPVNNTIAAVLSLWLASVMWTVIVEVMQDYEGLKDDLQAGVTSLAVAHRYHAKPLLSSAAMALVGCLFMTGKLIEAGPIYFAAGCGETAIFLTWLLVSVDLESPKSCLWWFRHGHWFVGGSIAGGLAAEYLSRRYGVPGWI